MNNFLKKTAAVLVGLVLLSLGGMIFFGRNGYLDYLVLKERRHQIRMDNQAIEIMNAELQRRTARLKTDLEYIAHVARQELGMVEKDELIYIYKTREEKP